MVTRETWGKVMAEFPSDLGKVRGSILRYMGQAERPPDSAPVSSALSSSLFFWLVGREAPGLCAVSEACLSLSLGGGDAFLRSRTGSPALLQEKTAFFSAVTV